MIADEHNYIRMQDSRWGAFAFDEIFRAFWESNDLSENTRKFQEAKSFMICSH